MVISVTVTVNLSHTGFILARKCVRSASYRVNVRIQYRTERQHVTIFSLYRPISVAHVAGVKWKRYFADSSFNQC